jgi:hypothetical protein
MPFFHDGTFHLFYLLDEGHHSALGGLGGHQWAHASSTDLVDWTHHPLAIPITEEWEGSICTGSAFFHDGTYYGFYATRTGDRTQHLSVATSTDGIHFEKAEPNPLAYPPPGYSPYHYRDPTVFRDEQTGLFHMLVTAWRQDHPLPDRGGCLAHLISTDLWHWQVKEPFIIPGYLGAPECPDHFFWNGWYYVLFSQGLVTHYRMSRHPLGPWSRPKVDVLDGRLARVMKTAAFAGGRRIGVAWLGTREGHQDDGRLQWGGNAIFRELVQHADGTLGTRFPTEMVPASGETLGFSFKALTSGASGDAHQIRLEAPEGLHVAALSPLPRNVRITAQVKPGARSALYGLRLRGSGEFERGYDLNFLPHKHKVDLHNESILAIEGLERAFKLDVVLVDDIIDVCIDDDRCILNRCPELNGDRLFFFCQDGDVTFDEIKVRPTP